VIDILLHPVYDQETAIIETGNTPCPIDLEVWQSRIDRMAGKTPSGLSNLRIVWGQDFSSTKMISCGVWRMRYPFFRFEEAGQVLDIGIPRFYVEELVPREDLMANNRWQNARYYTDPDDGRLIDVLGPCPETGFYETVFQVAHHDEQCCNGREVKDHEPCLGAYREPREADLDRIARILQRRDRATKGDLTPDPVQTAKRHKGLVEERNEKRDSQLREKISDFTKTHSFTWFTHDPTVISHGKYHWMSGHNKSGSPSGKDTTWKQQEKP